MPGVFRYAPMAGGAKQHIAGKPLPLMEALMPLCPEGGLVLDPFAGSGTTGLAALNTGRRFLGCELGADYHTIACRRLAEQPAQAKLAL
ncbi:MAG: site-specific DNA-methyltransferase [Gammaproteobacteria bacterium]|nr:site-specific DNA-methyltransferase [Gammaproteobacteria bacterium]